LEARPCATAVDLSGYSLFVQDVPAGEEAGVDGVTCRSIVFKVLDDVDMLSYLSCQVEDCMNETRLDV
jgi:hypothetical protein